MPVRSFSKRKVFCAIETPFVHELMRMVIRLTDERRLLEYGLPNPIYDRDIT